MNFTIKIMGVASAMPFSDRNPSAQVVDIHGHEYLIDCGEGTQQQLRRAHVSFVKIKAVFLTHIHGDHVFGIFGLLSSMSLYGRTEELKIYAPSNFGPILKFFLSFYGDDINFTVTHIPVAMKSPEVIYEDNCVEVSSFPLRHRIDTYGYLFREKISSRRKNPDYVPRPARSYAYCSDTTPFPELPQWVKGVTALYHDTTFTEEYADKAVKHFHSTASQAAQCALEAGAGRLLMGHYSSRIKNMANFTTEAERVFPNCTACNEGDIIEI